MYPNNDYAVRIYVAPNVDASTVAKKLWRPLTVTGGRCLAFRTAIEGENALRKIINETWDAPGIWRLLTTHEKTLVTVPPPGLVCSAEEIWAHDWLSKEVRPSCVCVAVRHERSSLPDDTPVWTREFRVFVGDHGCGPNGPLFVDLPPVSEHALLEEGVLALAALSNLG